MTREEILLEVSSGAIDPDQGEALARANRLPPLRYPDLELDEADPRLAHAWSLSMCVAWIVWRSFDEVRMELPDFWRHRDVWQALHTDGRPGWRLVGAPRPRLNTLNRGHPFTPGHPATADDELQAAIEALLDAMSKGEVNASGVEFPARVARRVKPEEWPSLIHGWRPADGDFYYCASDFSREIRHVELDQTEILRHWPEVASPDSPAAMSAQQAPKRRTVPARLIAEFLADPIACPDPGYPEVTRLYSQFLDYLKSKGVRRVPAEKTFRRHLSKINER